MTEISAGRETPVEELDLILRAYEGLWALSDSSSYEGHVVSALLFQLNKRFSDELARMGASPRVASIPSLRPV